MGPGLRRPWGTTRRIRRALRHQVIRSHTGASILISRVWVGRRTGTCRINANMYSHVQHFYVLLYISINICAPVHAYVICIHMCICIYIYRSCLVCPQDFELIRVWDSLVFEDDCEDELSLSLQATGELDENQTRKVLYLVCSQVDHSTC